MSTPPPKVLWLAAQQAKLVDMVANTTWQPSSPKDVPQEVFKAAFMMAASFLPGQRANVVSSAINLVLTYLISSDAQTRKDAEFTAMIKKLINPAITQYESATVIAQLKGCQRQFDNFYLHLDSLAKTPLVEVKKELVRVAYQALENDISCYYIFLAQKEGGEADTLDEFAVFATFHLMILRECVVNRSAWGFADSQISIYIEKFERCAAEYRAYVEKWYWSGYNKVKVPIAGDLYPSETWNRINYYRNTMVTSVWDYVNLWWFLSPRDFPKPGISYERVRYLYTDVYGVPYGSDTDPYDVPQLSVSAPFLNTHHMYQNELVSIEYVTNKYRMVSIQPMFHERGSSTNLSAGDLYGYPAYSDDYFYGSAKVDTNRHPNSCPRSVSVRYDIVPKMVSIYKDADATVPVERAGTDNTSPDGDFEERYIKLNGTRTPRVSFAGNKIGNIASIGINRDVTLAGLTNYYPILDTLSIGFIGNEVFSENALFSKISTCIDAQKYRTCGDDEGTSEGTTEFVYDAMGVGQHGITLIHPGVLLYEFELEDPSVLQYKISMLVAECTVEGMLMFCNPTNGAVMASVLVPVGTVRKVVHLAPSFTFPGAVHQDYAVKFSGSCVLSSIIFTPYPLAPDVPVFPPPPKVKPTTPNNPASYTDKKQWMSVQQANTSYSVLTAKEFVPPDKFNPWNYYKIMICCALNFIPGVGPIVAGATDIFLQFIIDYTSEDNTVSRYRQMVKNLIDTNITLYDNRVVKATYAGCAQSYHDFMLCLTNLRKLPANSILRESVRIAFMNLENDISSKYIYTAQKLGQQVEELMMFTLFATAHLTLLRECIMSGADWGFDPKTLKLYKDKFYNIIVEYRDYAIATYYKGYNSLASKTLFTSEVLFNNAYEYRNMMISSVFDFVNIWFMFDPAIYANVGVTHERVRYLYSKVYGTPRRKTLAEIEADIDGYGYHQFQGDLVKVTAIHDSTAYKFGKVTPRFGKNYKYHDGTQLNDYYVNPTFQVTEMVQFNPKTPCTSVNIMYDYFPRTLDFTGASGTNSKINTIILDSWGQAGTAFKQFSGPELSWYSLTGNRDREGYGGINVVATMPDHKLANVFQLATEDRADFVSNKFGSSANGFVDGLVLAWLPAEIFAENYIEPDMITMVDCQKYLDKSDNAAFTKDHFMPGVHAFKLAPGAWMEFEFTPRDPAVNQFSVMLRFDCKIGTNATLVNKKKAAETFTFGIVAVWKTVYVPTTEKVVIMDAADKNNVYRLTNSGTQPFHIQSILFRPKGK
eukprot:gene7675-8981_t